MDRFTPRVVAVGGSLAPRSRTLAALRVAADAAREAGGAVEVLGLRELGLPLFTPDAGAHAGVRRLVTAARAADALLLATPVYHGTVSGAFKNALDLLEFLGDGYLDGRVVGILSVAGGTSSTAAIDAIAHAAAALHALVVPTSVAVPGHAFDGEGRLASSRHRTRLTRLATEVVTLTTRIAGGRALAEAC